MKILYRLSLCIILFISIAYPSGLVAAPPLEISGAPDCPSSFAPRVIGCGPSVAYFNPSLLLSEGKPVFLGGVSLFSQSFTITMNARPSGFDVPSSIFESKPSDSTSNTVQRPLPTELLRNLRGSTNPSRNTNLMFVGTSLISANKKVAFGFFAILPSKSFQSQSPFYVDEREQYFSNSLHFELFEDRLESNHIILAGAYSPIPTMTVGAGFTLNTTAMAHTELFMPDASKQDESMLNSSIEVTTKLVPHFSVTWKPYTDWLAAITCHFPAESRTDGVSNVQFWNYNNESGSEEVVQKFTQVNAYEPLRIAVGIGRTPKSSGNDKITAGFNFVWARWSTYLDRHGDRPAIAWKDTVSPEFSLRYPVGKKQEIGIGGMYVPSPVPTQEGRSNYVDNHRTALSIGYRGTFEWLDTKVFLGLNASWMWLIPRNVTKNPDAANGVIDEFPDSVNIFTNEDVVESHGVQTNNPGFPGYSHEGHIFNISVYLGVPL
jgi:hypothetical protein